MSDFLFPFGWFHVYALFFLSGIFLLLLPFFAFDFYHAWRQMHEEVEEEESVSARPPHFFLIFFSLFYSLLGISGFALTAFNQHYPDPFLADSSSIFFWSHSLAMLFTILIQGTVVRVLFCEEV